MKKIISLLCVLFMFFSCNKEQQPIKIVGESIGTFYNILYYDNDNRDFSEEIQKELELVMKSCNIFDSTSTISMINANKSNQLDDITKEILLRSFEISNETGGYFDVTAGGLVSLWGFGPKSRINREINNEEIDSVHRFVGYRKVHISGDLIKKDYAETIIDFGAIAKGYSVDLISRLLNSKGVNSYLIEIGGEIYAKGTKPDGKQWIIGISVPDEEDPCNQEFQERVCLENKALATSGNYRNFYKVKGDKRVHTISPLTGRPIENELLSVTIIANDCMTADAFATAMMVMGLEKGVEVINKNKELDAYFIYHEDDEIKTFATQGFKALILQ